MGTTVALAFATIFCIGALFFVALSFGTDNWTNFKVTESALTGVSSEDLKTKPIYQSRTRGLFKECLKNRTNIDNIPGTKVTKLDGGCYTLVDYQIPGLAEYDNLSNDYWARTHLMRATVGFFTVSMVFLFIGSLLGAIACWRTDQKYSRNTGIVVFIAAFFVAFGMAVFHGAEYLEKNVIKDQAPNGILFQSTWNTVLTTATTRTYDWSYILGWVGTGCAAISAAIFLISAWLMSMKERDEKEAMESYSLHGRNRAYEYVEKTPYYPQAQPQPQGSYPTAYYGGSGYVGPYEYDPRVGYEDYGWGWNRY